MFVINTSELDDSSKTSINDPAAADPTQSSEGQVSNLQSLIGLL